jgi:hypothetical protein
MTLRNIVWAALGLTALAAFAEGADAQDAARQQPAVSGLNGKLSLEGGAIGNDGAGSSALGIAEGSISAPLGHSFGLQVDGAGASAYNTFLGG